MARPPGPLDSLLFPDPPRELAFRRPLKIVLRALHVVSAALLLGAYAFGASQPEIDIWLYTTLGSGVLIMILDLHESAAFLLQLRGLVVVAKLVSVAVLPWLGGATAWLLAAVVLISVISSHAPGRWRYFLLLGRDRISPSRSKG